ncbi:hypothetical protein [Deinococcus lacus]
METYVFNLDFENTSRELSKFDQELLNTFIFCVDDDLLNYLDKSTRLASEPSGWIGYDELLIMSFGETTRMRLSFKEEYSDFSTRDIIILFNSWLNIMNRTV